LLNYCYQNKAFCLKIFKFFNLNYDLAGEFFNGLVFFAQRKAIQKTLLIGDFGINDLIETKAFF